MLLPLLIFWVLDLYISGFWVPKSRILLNEIGIYSSGSWNFLGIESSWLLTWDEISCLCPFKMHKNQLRCRIFGYGHGRHIFPVTQNSSVEFHRSVFLHYLNFITNDALSIHIWQKQTQCFFFLMGINIWNSVYCHDTVNFIIWLHIFICICIVLLYTKWIKFCPLILSILPEKLCLFTNSDTLFPTAGNIFAFVLFVSPM